MLSNSDAFIGLERDAQILDLFGPAHEVPTVRPDNHFSIGEILVDKKQDIAMFLHTDRIVVRSTPSKRTVKE